MGGGRRRATAWGSFAVLALLGEMTGRALIVRLDEAFQVAPLATPTTGYYPILLAAVRVLAAGVVAAFALRAIRAHAAAVAGERLLGRIGRRPRLRVTLSLRLWAYAFAAMSLWYLAQNDAARLSTGRWPLLGPWLHTYALPVFAVCSLLLAVAWGAVRSFIADVERYVATLARTRPAVARPAKRRPVATNRAPRTLFGVVFESRPPPLLA